MHYEHCQVHTPAFFVLRKMDMMTHSSDSFPSTSHLGTIWKCQNILITLTTTIEWRKKIIFSIKHLHSTWQCHMGPEQFFLLRSQYVFYSIECVSNPKASTCSLATLFNKSPKWASKPSVFFLLVIKAFVWWWHISPGVPSTLFYDGIYIASSKWNNARCVFHHITYSLSHLKSDSYFFAKKITWLFHLMVTQIVLFSFSTSRSSQSNICCKEKCSLYEGRERETYSNKKSIYKQILSYFMLLYIY